MPVTEERARELREAGLKYAGVSVDGLRERNDAFRGQEGAFDEALGGIDAARAAGLKTGLRYTITRHNGGVPTETDDRVSALAFRVISPCWSVPDTHLSYPGRWISNIAGRRNR